MIRKRFLVGKHSQDYWCSLRLGLAPIVVTAKAAVLVANSMAVFSFLPWDRLATNAPAKESPAPVGSTAATFSASKELVLIPSI